MSPPQSKAGKHQSSADTSEAVDRFMAELEHPHKPAIQLLRECILATDGAIDEGIKWKSPSFRVDEYFATVNLRSKVGIGLILHLGAKVRDLPDAGLRIDDPEQLLQWLARDRAQIEFRSLQETRDRAPALQALLRHWIQYV